ncbi:MAG: DUF6733 family protein [Halieaceae bacterium]|jgi:hypothetical protein|nr:DUF6733 family protein [Halieaceae bacterium]
MKQYSSFKGLLPVAMTGLIAMAPATAVMAQEEMEDKGSYTITLNQDTFFGFYPSFNGLWKLNDNMDFSFYGIMWTSDGLGGGAGNDLWTEFGGGLNMHYMDDKLTVKPQIGVTNGLLQSNGADDGAGSNFADGVVPSLTINYGDDKWEAEFYGGYYLAARNRDDDGTGLDFIHTWVNGGYKINPIWSVGAHWEYLELARVEGGDDAVLYEWLGLYTQFSLPNGMFARFTAGDQMDDESGEVGDFYKMTVGFSL